MSNFASVYGEVKEISFRGKIGVTAQTGLNVVILKAKMTRVSS